MPSLRIYLFGTPQVERDGQSLSITRRKTIALLAYLATTNQPHSREFLATLFWPEHDQAGARANLRRDISRLKNSTGDGFLLVDRFQAGLHPEAEYWLDVAVFKAHVDLVRNHDHFPQTHCPACANACQEAAALYTAGFMSGFSLPDSVDFDEWQFFQTESLRQSLSELLQRLIQWHMSKGEFEQGIEHGRRRLSLDSLHEPAHRQLMRLYAWAGQQAAALRQYEECTRLLKQELDVEPEPETVSLFQSIKNRTLEPPVIIEEDPRPTEDTRRPTGVDQPLASDTPHPTGDTQPATSHAPALSVPQRYQAQTLLASGSHGQVFLGLDHSTGHQVVIKQLKPELMTAEPEYLARFQQEGEILGQLNHPNIVQFLALYHHQQEEQYCIVMEYVPGGSLRQLLDEAGQLSVQQALNIALELADALGRAHHLGVIHRDLKPENVLLAQDGTPRLTDFGVARLERASARLTQTGALIGSPAYMSPEALQGQPTDGRSDIWSLAALLYEMIGGVPPFGSGQIATTLLNILQAPAPDLRHVASDAPAPLARLIRRMLAKEPAQRPDSMRQVAAVLEAICEGRDVDIDAPLAGADTAPLPSKETPPPAPLPARPHYLPVQPTPFIGREEELAHTGRLLVDDPNCRLLTLVGPGGVGKTRLAIETGRRVLPAFPDGVFFVSLASVSHTGFIAPAIAEALDMQFSGAATARAQLLHFLRPKKLLLILDNVEHLLEGREMMADLLRFAPHLKALVTSRQRLQIEEEWGYELRGLSFPTGPEPMDAQALQNYSAVQLFIQRARRADASFSLDGDDIPAVVDICRLLDGMPLGLELAAPRVRASSCPEIAVDIERHLDSLASPAPDSPQRHHRLRAMFNQAWQTMPVEEQTLLRRLAIFQGGCSREAAGEVAGATVPLLAALLDRALLRRDSHGRYTLHELIRQFAAEKSQATPGEEAAAREKHAHYYLTFLAQRTPGMKGSRQRAVLSQITADIDNVRAAWQYAVAERHIEALAGAAECYWLFSEFRGILHEGEKAFGKAIDALALVPGAGPLLNFLKAGQGSLMARRGWLVEGVAQMEAAIPLLKEADPPDRQKEGFALAWLSFALVTQGRYSEARRTARKSLDLFPQTQDYWTQAGCLRLLGASALFRGQLDKAQELLQACLEACAQMGEQRIQTYARANLGRIAMLRGEYGQAGQWLDEAQELSRQLGDQLSRADLLRERGMLAIVQGRYPRAASLLQESQQLSQKIGRNDAGSTTYNLGMLWLHQGERQQARSLFQQSIAAAKAVGHQAGVAHGLYQMGLLAYEQGQLNQAEQLLQESLTGWQRINHEPMIASVRGSLGHLTARGDEMRAGETRQHFRRALQLALKHGLAPVALEVVARLAPLSIHANSQGDTARLLLLAEQHPASTHRTRQEAGRQLAALPAGEIATARKEGQLPEWQETAAGLLSALEPETSQPGEQREGGHNLPLYRSPFVGREQALADTGRLLVEEKSTLLTLVGPGGSGKTRLSVETAAATAAHFPHGVYYVPLAPLESAGQILTTLAGCIGYNCFTAGDPDQQVLDYLRNKQMLVILDNYEHLLPSTSPVAQIIAAAPGVQILATSRVRLNLGDETTYALTGMGYPEAGENGRSQFTNYSAVRLLLAQAQLVRPDYQLQPEDEPHIARICRLVQGMPLALELAAGWLDMLSFEEIGEEISRSLDFLESERGDLPQRQRSMRAVFEGSWDRLAPEARQALARLTVFRGGFNRQAAQAVANASLRGLRSLINSSFLAPSSSGGRYEIHELLRHYALEKLAGMGEAESTQAAHAAYFLDFMQQREEEVKGKRQAGAIQEIEMDLKNVRAAWKWAVDQGDRPAIDGAMETLHLFCDLRGRHMEGAALFARAKEQLAPPPGSQPDVVWGRILLRNGFLRVFVPDLWDAALKDLEQGLAIAQAHQVQEEMAIAYQALGTLNYSSGQDPQVALDYFKKGNALFSSMGDTFYLARSLVSIGFCHASLSDLDSVEKYTNEALHISRKSGNMADASIALANLGEFVLGMGQYETAESHFQEAIGITKSIDVPSVLAFCHPLLSLIHLLRGDLAQAGPLVASGLNLAQELNHAIPLAYAGGVMGLCKAMEGEFSSSRQWANESRENPANNTLGLVVAPWGLALTHCGLGQWAEAKEALDEALTTVRELGFPAPPLWLMPVAAVLVAVEGRPARAVELLALASTHPLKAAGWTRHWPLLAQTEARLKQELGLAAFEAAWEKGKALDILDPSVPW